MTSLPGCAEFRGLSYYRSQDDPATFSYLPADPSAERDQHSRPTLILWASDQGAILQLGARWEAGAVLLTAFRQYLAEQLQLEPAVIRLSPMPVAIAGVTLAVGNGAGQFTELQTTTASGYAPFAAIFNVTLTPEQKAHTIAALNGRAGFLTITYRGSVSLSVTAEATIEGDVRADLTALGDNPSLAECQARIITALAAGRLILQQTGTVAAPDTLRQKAEQLAKEKAAAALLRLARGAGAYWQTDPELAESTLKSSAALTDTVAVPLERSTDVASWFPSGTGLEHVQMVGTTIGEQPKPTRPASVRLGFDAKGAPIAMIQVTAGQSSVVLRGPTFSPVTLPATAAGEPLVIKTSFTTGGPSYDVTLSAPPAAEWSLTPADLGLARVTLDATARRKAGATSAHIRVHYHPLGAGTEDEQVINFRYGDWTESWYVITRSTGLGGSLEVAWKETTADGSVVTHPSVTTDNPELSL